MRSLVILGAGSAGTMIANMLRPTLDRHEWSMTIVARDDIHDYQPGYLFLPFRRNPGTTVRRNAHTFLPDGVEFVVAEIDRIDVATDTVHLTGGRELAYDYLVIATGTTPRPEQTPGLPEALATGTAAEFYTHDGALRTRAALDAFTGGRLVVHVAEMPIKCPVAPMEFALLADDTLRSRGLREQTQIVYATPLPGAFTRPVASARLGELLARRGIQVEPDFAVSHVDPTGQLLASYDGRELAYDLLVTVPVNMGDDAIARSGLGDELNHVHVDPGTMQAVGPRLQGRTNIFALGDANDLPTSKAGSVAHFSAHVFAENFRELAAGRPMPHRFDGHANCFVESGGGKALLLDFNYDTEPLPGLFPLPGVGPLTLLKESRVNHLSKLAAGPLYWNVLLRGRPVPFPTAMSMRGKDTSAAPDDPAPSADTEPDVGDAPIVPTF